MVVKVVEAVALRITVEATSTVRCIRLEGELDLASADMLHAEYGSATEDAEIIMVDLTDLTFCDVAGAQALMALRASHLLRGRRIVFLNACAQVRKLFTLMGEETLV